MTSPRTNAAAAITPPAASIKLPLRLHFITNVPGLHPMCGNCQTRPRLGHASSISEQQWWRQFSTIDVRSWSRMRSYSPPSAFAFRQLSCRPEWAVGMAIMW
jgi:hypothetical protein